jgi:hypothetical protein
MKRINGGKEKSHENERVKKEYRNGKWRRMREGNQHN